MLMGESCGTVLIKGKRDGVARYTVKVAKKMVVIGRRHGR